MKPLAKKRVFTDILRKLKVNQALQVETLSDLRIVRKCAVALKNQGYFNYITQTETLMLWRTE